MLGGEGADRITTAEMAFDAGERLRKLVTGLDSGEHDGEEGDIGV